MPEYMVNNEYGEMDTTKYGFINNSILSGLDTGGAMGAEEYVFDYYISGDMDPANDVDSGLKYAPPVVMWIISTLGLVFNIIVIVLILMIGDYKKTSHWYVLNLAVADGIFLITLPLGAVENLSQEWKFGSVSCQLYHGAFYGNYYASIYFLTMMSFDRYVAILYPMSLTWRKFRSRIGSFVSTAIIWILAAVSALPLIMNTKLIPKDDFYRELANETAYKCDFDFSTDNQIMSDEIQECLHKGIPLSICEDMEGATNRAYRALERGRNNVSLSVLEGGSKNASKDTNNLAMSESYKYEGLHKYCSYTPYPQLIAWVYVNAIVTFVIPIVVMVFCYGCILWRVLHPRIPVKQSSFRKDSAKSLLNRRHSSSSSSTSQRRNHRVTVLVVSLVAAFIACWTPFQITNVMRLEKLAEDGLTCKQIVVTSNLLAYFSSMLNPLLYTFLGANFRKRARKALTKIQGQRRSSAGAQYFKHGNSQGRGSIATRATKTGSSDTANLSHINMQLLPLYHKREKSVA